MSTGQPGRVMQCQRCGRAYGPGGSAYTYLPASVRRFPGPDQLAELMRDAAFADVRYRLLAGGIVALHTGVAA